MSWLRAPVLGSLSLLVGCVEYVVQAPDVEAIPPVLVEEHFVQAPLPDVDVLFVVDSTGSMADEQASLAGASAAFLGALDALELTYQVGVTTADPRDQGMLKGRPWIVTGASTDPAGALAEALAVGTASAPPAAGLYAAALALQDEGSFNRGFRREEAGLHVIFLSDGDDQSDTWLGIDPVAAFEEILSDEAAVSGHLARVSAIVGDVPDGCRSDAGEALAGTRYAAMADATGGQVESICDADFARVAAALGDVAVEWPTRFPLQARPVEGSLVVEIDGERVADGWWLQGVAPSTADPALVFNFAPAADAEIDVSYTLDDGSSE